jgi:hypothetical protein
MPPKKKITTDITNFYELDDVKKNNKALDNPNESLHHIKIPFRMGLIAGSGMGKTNALMNIINLFSQGKGTFSHIYIYHKLDEPLYDYLAEKCKDKITFYKQLAKVPNCRDLKPDEDNIKDKTPALFIFDDCIADKDQSKIADYFIYGRKALGGNGICCMYLSQNYFSIPKVIRGQLTYIILLKIRGNRDLKMILNDNNIGLDIDDFEDIYKDATNENLSFLKIDIANRDDNQILSKGFDNFYDISEMLQ